MRSSLLRPRAEFYVVARVLTPGGRAVVSRRPPIAVGCRSWSLVAGLAATTAVLPPRRASRRPPGGGRRASARKSRASERPELSVTGTVLFEGHAQGAPPLRGPYVFCDEAGQRLTHSMVKDVVPDT